MTPRSTTFFKILILLLLVGPTLLSGAPVPPPAVAASSTLTPHASRLTPCSIIRITDGDTLVCAVSPDKGFKSLVHKVRLIGVFAPELGMAGADEAREQLIKFAPIGSTVTLEFDRELRDKYGRVLAYVITADDLNVNLEIVRAGWAETSDAFPFKLYKTFRKAERHAVDQQLGIWKQMVCITPKGKFYHPCGCFHLSRSKKIIRLTRAAAKKQGLKPCKTLLGDCP